MKIFDCCILFNEIDVLKMRLKLLYEHVDKFVICEANITHSGHPKEYNFLKHQAEFEPWIDKIIFLKYEPDVSALNFLIKPEVFDSNTPHWQVENGQRNYLATFLLSQNDEDYAFICDVDEIWRPWITDYLRKGLLKVDLARLEMSFHYYYMNCEGIGKHNSVWAQAFFTKIKVLRKNPDLSKFRNYVEMPRVEHAGWHFSYLGGVESIINKINAFAHQEINKDWESEQEFLLSCIRKGKDYLNRDGHEFAFHPVEYYTPELVKMMIDNPKFVRSDLLEDLARGPKLMELRTKIALEAQRFHMLQLQFEGLKRERDSIVKSISWRLTKPLREINRLRANPKKRFTDYLNIIKRYEDRTPIAWFFKRKKLIYYSALQAQKIKSISDTSEVNKRFSEFSLEFETLTIEEKKIKLLDELNQWAYSSNFISPPTVSVIIPIFGKIEYTLRLLVSISRHLPKASLEIIVVNDFSPDDSISVLSKFSWVRIINNEQNQGFIRSCNIGAKNARGEFLLFLNNDTEVTEGWLDELLRTFVLLPGTGLAGSKLMYPDGRLQEAGGIVWSDASAWNYGRLQNPLLPEFNYAREVDYCSGASIMIPASLFKDLQGFDEYYLPAYYEDVDLALKVREKGLRVIYQPLSVVIHHEGITSGTDVTQGVKAYQEINKEKIFTRWSQRLAGHQLPGVDPDNAKDRRANKRILILDHNTPTPTKDAGSLLTINLMILMREMGFQVTFLAADNFLFLPETIDLQRRGIEVHYLPFTNTVEDHLKEYSRRYDLIMLIRPGIVDKNWELVRRYCPGTPIIYHTIDLHYLRLQREAQLKDDSNILDAAEKMRLSEHASICLTDLTIVVSTTEKKILQLELPDASIEVLPLIMEVSPNKVSPQGRKNIAFVGSFGHSPNVDAVLFFTKEVMPLLREMNLDIKFYVVGTNPPPEVLKLECNDIVIKGYVEDLTEFYSSIRVNVAPLRFGAGLKGKVAGALAMGVPTVATSLAVEGMGVIQEQNVLIANSSQEIAEAVKTLYTNDELWQFISNNGIDYAEYAWGVLTNYSALANIIKQSGLEIDAPIYPFELYSQTKDSK